MSPNVSSFVHDLVDMARAMEQLPQVQAELDAVRAELNAARETIQQREQRIFDLKGETERLNDALRQAEVARDNAETMFLELDSKSDNVVRSLDSIRDLVLAARNTLSPPKPAPVPETVAVQSPEPVQAGVSVEDKLAVNQALETGKMAWPGQSDAAPTVVTSDTPNSVGLEAVTPEVAGLTGEGSSGVSVSVDPTPAPHDSTTGTTTPMADTSATDPVTYADEPGPAKPDGFMDWERWYDWAGRMDRRYGAGKWPARVA